jgi:hypothetical protein
MVWSIYADATGLWQWELLDSNSKPIAHSTHGFPRRDDCLADASRHGYAGEHDGPLDHGGDGPESP